MYVNRTELFSTESAMTGVPQQFVEPPPLRAFRLVLISAIILASLVGNSLLIRAVAIAPAQKTITYYLVSNLALAELLSTCCLPFVYVYIELARWPFGNAACHCIIPLQIMTVLVVTSTIATIAAYRCSVVLRPLRTRNSRMKPKAALCGCASLWLAAFLVALPSFINHRQVDVVQGSGDTIHWCLTLFPNDSLQSYPSTSYRVLILFQFMLNYVVSTVVLVVSYGIVVFNISCKIPRLAPAIGDTTCTKINTEIVNLNADVSGISSSSSNRSTASSSSSCDASKDDLPLDEATESTNKNANTGEIKELFEYEIKELFEYEINILGMFYAIVLVFVLCYFPYQVFFLMENFGEMSWKNFEYFDITRAYVYVLVCLPSALHPICYGLMSKFYAKELSKLFCSRAQ